MTEGVQVVRLQVVRSATPVSAFPTLGRMYDETGGMYDEIGANDEFGGIHHMQRP
jgi:hypothetical protein